MPPLVDPDLNPLKKWDNGDGVLIHLMQKIENEPDAFVLDPSWCESDDCEYSRGPLRTQRYVLLKRLYQIQCSLRGLVPKKYKIKTYVNEIM